jgi:hypothetical protein
MQGLLLLLLLQPLGVTPLFLAWCSWSFFSREGGVWVGMGIKRSIFGGGGKIPITLGTLLASYSNKHKLKKNTHTHLQTHPPWKLLMPNPNLFSSQNTW